ncbi:MAG: prenyltransferase [Desulfobacterium sp.]|nr:prenyltransferase [Desulfobacterium sp.]
MDKWINRIRAAVRLARPHQYLKNGFIWLPIFFGYGIGNIDAVIHTLYAFLGFCCAASFVYIINDLKDVESDRLHPTKRFRPLAANDLRRAEAIFISILFLFALSAISYFLLPHQFWWIVGGYIVLNLLYSVFLKQVAVIDVICISLGFVLRIFAGGTAANIENSPWIIIMTFLIALFLALAKRRDDLLLSDEGNQMRKSLDGYNREFVSSAMIVMASVIIVSYLLYTVSPEVIQKHGSRNFYLSAFWVIAGLLRYMQITFVEEKSGSPTVVLIQDLFLKIVVLLWLVSVYVLIY